MLDSTAEICVKAGRSGVLGYDVYPPLVRLTCMMGADCLFLIYLKLLAVCSTAPAEDFLWNCEGELTTLEKLLFLTELRLTRLT
jgi:hypothetical protein